MKAISTGIGAALFANGTPAFGRRAAYGFLCAVMITVPVLAGPASVPHNPADDDLRVRLETTPVKGGAELWTVFVALPPEQSKKYSEMPVLSVLQDTLGRNDAECARIDRK